MNDFVPNPAAELYLDLMKKCLTRSIFPETFRKPMPQAGSWRKWVYAVASRLAAAGGFALVKHFRFDAASRAEGMDHPPEADTMIGLKRLDNLEFCITQVLRNGVSGDLIETGVWRGGATIFMRAVLKAYGDTRRLVWVADSFQGVPRPSPKKYPADAADPHWKHPELPVSESQVRANFHRYGLLDDQVRFLAGWFGDRLPQAPIDRLSILRLDGDMYESTWDALHALYDKVSPGGYVIVDDYHAVHGCRRATDEFRARRGIADALTPIDRLAVYWQKSAHETPPDTGAHA
jgi:O-methyltransferase